MRARSCLNNLLFLLLLTAAFGGSAFFWFTYFVRGRSVPTPTLVGRPMAQARALASDAGLLLELDPSRNRHADNIPAGAVVWQNQPPGRLVKRGTHLIVGNSLGPLVLRVPELLGQSPRAALLQLSQLNLRPGGVGYTPRTGGEGVIAADPPVGTVLGAGAPVSLLVGFPHPPVRWVMPDLVDRQADPVRAALQQRGLSVGQVRYEPYPGIADGTIIRQYPTPGAPVSSRDVISLVVSRQEGSPAEP